MSNAGRWIQLLFGIFCMAMIANLQYGWTLFVHPISQKHGWSVAAIQVAFSIFVALETWLTPIEGWIVDRLGAQIGPKLMVAFGGVNSPGTRLQAAFGGAHRRLGTSPIMIAAPGPFLLDVQTPYQEHVLPMIPSGMTVRDMIKV